MAELRAEVGRAAQALQAAVDAVDHAAATNLGVNRTDLRCLEILWHGPSTPGVLAAELGHEVSRYSAAELRLVLDYLQRSRDLQERHRIRIANLPKR